MRSIISYSLSIMATSLLAVLASSYISVGAQTVPQRGPIPFASYDKDGDGLISEQEFNAAHEKRMAQRNAMRRAAAMSMFSEFDTNADGQLTEDELAAGRSSRMSREGPGQTGGMGRGMKKGRNMPAFSDYDLNQDGKILEDEFNEARANRVRERVQQGYRMRNLDSAPAFADLDTDADGAINVDEFNAHQFQHRRWQRTP